MFGIRCTELVWEIKTIKWRNNFLTVTIINLQQVSCLSRIEMITRLDGRRRRSGSHGQRYKFLCLYVHVEEDDRLGGSVSLDGPAQFGSFALFFSFSFFFLLYLLSYMLAK
jgi:hypothetical protein